MSRRELRKQLRAQRRSVSPPDASAASQALCRRILTDLSFLRARHVAFYMPEDGEMDPTLLMANAASMGKHCYLPVITDTSPWHHHPLSFVLHDPFDDVMVLNRYGIPEPPYTRRTAIAPHMLDIVFVPLVGFDRRGARLGMGQGFYDRTFGGRARFHRPQLVGLAYALQEMSDYEANSWDVPLDAVATELEFFRVSRTRGPGRPR